MQKLTPALLLFFVTIAPVYAEDEQACKQLVVGSEHSWEPYSFVGTDGSYAGVGAKIVRTVAKELDLPVRFQTIDHFIERKKRTKFTSYDLLDGVYLRKDYEDHVEYVQPGYASDTLAVVIHADRPLNNFNWKSLGGGVGGTTDSYVFDPDFQKNIRPYLFIRPESTGKDLVALLKDMKLEYGIGSKNLIRSQIKALNLGGQLKVLADQSLQDPVFIAFSNRSPCRVYAPYFKRRIMDWKADGTLQRWLDEFLPKEQLPTEPSKNKPVAGLG